jgi:hypothetical protein
VINSIKSIDYYDYVTSITLISNKYNKNKIGIDNNTKVFIPNDLIKDLYFTDIYNNDGSNLRWDRDTSYYYLDNRLNGVLFKPCDKKQTIKTKILIKLINGKELITIHDREVIIA